MKFKDQIVLVTGSSRGIGKAIALDFAKQGALVVLNGYKNKGALLATYDEFIQAGYKVLYYLGDVSTFEIAQDLFNYIHQVTSSHPHIIINNAGISYSGLFTDTIPSLWHQIMQTNLNSAYNCSFLGIPSMIREHKGIIINISSIWGNVGASCEVAYSTSKSALNGFTKSLAKELGPSNIRINAISCGWIDTDMNACYSSEDKENFIAEVPLMRTGTSQDVAQTCLYLASDASAYMTGQILTLDGGLL